MISRGEPGYPPPGRTILVSLQRFDDFVAHVAHAPNRICRIFNGGRIALGHLGDLLDTL